MMTWSEWFNCNKSAQHNRCQRESYSTQFWSNPGTKLERQALFELFQPTPRRWEGTNLFLTLDDVYFAVPNLVRTIKDVGYNDLCPCVSRNVFTTTCIISLLLIIFYVFHKLKYLLNSLSNASAYLNETE